MSTVWQTVVCSDDEGAEDPLVATWETPRDQATVERVRARISETFDGQDSGSWIHSSYPLMMSESCTQRSQHRHLDIGGWLLEQLLGVRTGWSEAIAAGSGLWSSSARNWSQAAVNLGIEPSLRNEAILRHPLSVTDPDPRLPVSLRDALWLPPLPDGLCHNLGTGAVGDRMAITVGTSGSTRLVDDVPFEPRPDGYWHYRCDESTFVCGGAVSSAGNLLEWGERFSGRPIDWSFADANTPNISTLLVHPDVFGRRGPDYPSVATGGVSGMRPSHTAVDITQATAVDVWSSFHRMFKNFERSRTAKGVTVGGGVIERVPQAAQLLADAIGFPVIVTTEKQPALRGTARYAAQYIESGAYSPSLDELLQDLKRRASNTSLAGRVVSPRDAWVNFFADRWQ